MKNRINQRISVISIINLIWDFIIWIGLHFFYLGVSNANVHLYYSLMIYKTTLIKQIAGKYK